MFLFCTVGGRFACRGADVFVSHPIGRFAFRGSYRFAFYGAHGFASQSRLLRGALK